MRITILTIDFSAVWQLGTRVLERIVVPLDGSSEAERAVPVATSLAAHLGAELLLLTTRADVDDQSPQAYLDKVAGSVPAPLSVKSDVVIDGDPVASISAAASFRLAGVCMATHARGRVLGALHSSVGEQVLEAVPGPVFLIGPQCETTELGDGPILFAHDGSDGANRTGRSLLGLLAALGHRLEVVTVVPAPMGHSDDEPYAATKAAIQPLLDAATDLGMQATHRLVFANDAPRGLLSEIEMSSTSIAVMASRHRSVIERLREGSTTTNVLHHAKVPVLVTRLP